jgi:hypothetical protein
MGLVGKWEPQWASLTTLELGRALPMMADAYGVMGQSGWPSFTDRLPDPTWRTGMLFPLEGLSTV